MLTLDAAFETVERNNVGLRVTPHASFSGFAQLRQQESQKTV